MHAHLHLGLTTSRLLTKSPELVITTHREHRPDMTNELLVRRVISIYETKTVGERVTQARSTGVFTGGSGIYCVDAGTVGIRFRGRGGGME